MKIHVLIDHPEAGRIACGVLYDSVEFLVPPQVGDLLNGFAEEKLLQQTVVVQRRHAFKTADGVAVMQIVVAAPKHARAIHASLGGVL